RLDPLADEPMQNLQAVAAHRLGRLRAVWNTRRVAVVDGGLVGQPLEHRTGDGQSADTGIEDPDRSVAHRSRIGMLTSAAAPPGTRRTLRSPGKSQSWAETYASSPDSR